MRLKYVWASGVQPIRPGTAFLEPCLTYVTACPAASCMLKTLVDRTSWSATITGRTP